MANGAADPQAANKELRRLLKGAISKAKRAARDDREWWSTEIDTLCEKMAPLWSACGVKTPGIWTDGGNKLHPSPVPAIHLKTLDPDTQAVRGTILQSGRGEDAYNARAGAVLDLMDVAERWIDWLELRGVAASPALPEVSKNAHRPFEAASWDALRGDLESLRANFGRLFSMEVRAVVQSSRKYWPSRYREPKGPQLGPEPPGEWRGFRFVTGQGMAVKPRGPRSAEEADKAETFYANGEAIVDASGKPLIAVQGWAEDNLTFCVGPGADRFMETLDLANRIVSMHASILTPILFDDSSGITFCAHAWPSIVNRVAEIAGRATLRPPVWKVSNGQTSWTVRAWKQRDKVALSRPFYSPADVELIGDEPEAVYADRETIIRDSELTLDWLLETLREPPRADYPAELPPELDATLTLRDRQVFYAQNPDLPLDAFEGAEAKVRAELEAAGIEYVGNPIEWLRSTAGGRYVEQRFSRLLESVRAGAGNLTTQEIEAIAERVSERVAKAHREHGPQQLTPAPMNGSGATELESSRTAEGEAAGKTQLQESLARCIAGIDWFLSLPPQEHVSNTGVVPFYSPLLATFSASDGTELIGRELVPIPPPFVQVCEALLASPQAALGVELQRRAGELERSILAWREGCHLVVEQWRWDNDCIGDLPDNLYVIFGDPPTEIVDSLEAIRGDARTIRRLLQSCEKCGAFSQGASGGRLRDDELSVPSDPVPPPAPTTYDFDDVNRVLICGKKTYQLTPKQTVFVEVLFNAWACGRADTPDYAIRERVWGGNGPRDMGEAFRLPATSGLAGAERYALVWREVIEKGKRKDSLRLRPPECVPQE